MRPTGDLRSDLDLPAPARAALLMSALGREQTLALGERPSAPNVCFRPEADVGSQIGHTP